MTLDQAAEYGHVTIRQLIAYQDGRARPHPAVVELITLRAAGAILDGEWWGYSIQDGRLTAPGGRPSMTRAELDNWTMYYQLARLRGFNEP